jgi:hypothetical protein
MSDEQTSATATPVYSDEVTPDSMMNDFRGRPVVGILSFTVIVHVVLISVFSFGYMKNELFGEDTSSMSEDERLKVAVQEATTSLREIAERHGLSPQDLTTQFAGRDARPVTSPPAIEPSESETPGGAASPDAPQSAIEKELNTKGSGPILPDLPPDLPTEEDDLF